MPDIKKLLFSGSVQIFSFPENKNHFFMYHAAVEKHQQSIKTVPSYEQH